VLQTKLIQDSTRRTGQNQADRTERAQSYDVALIARRFTRSIVFPHRHAIHSISSNKYALTWTRLSCIKIGAKVVSHSRRTTFQMAEVAGPEALFAALLERIRCLAGAPT